MNELSGAVAVAQVRKMKGVVALRRARGDLLSQLLADNPYAVPQRLLDGCKHTYWQYGMRVTEGAPIHGGRVCQGPQRRGRRVRRALHRQAYLPLS